MWVARILIATLLLLVATGCAQTSMESRLEASPSAKVVPTRSLTGAPPQVPKPHHYPERPITILVGSSKGSDADLAARILAARLEKELQYPVLVSNRPDEEGLHAWTQMKTSKADGYTLALVPSPQIQVAIQEGRGAVPLSLADFVPLAGHIRDPMALFVRSGSPFKGIEEFITAARAQPDRLSVSIPQKSVVSSLAAEELQRKAALKLKVSPFADGTNALFAALGGQADVAIGSYASALPMVRSGQGRFLAVLADERLPGETTLPTLREKGIDVVSQSSMGYAVPQNVAPDILDYLRWSLYLCITDPNHQSKLKDAGLQVRYLDGKQFASLLDWERERVGQLMKK